jgi:amidase/6-aminohexanoate-cyclic-dimer hydrolase
MDFDEYTAHDGLGLAELVRSGEVKPAELLDSALARMEEVNPAINAVVLDMRDEARRVVDAGVPEGPFSGVPFLLKDLGLLYKGSVTSYGCNFFADNEADHDSELVLRYKRAGLVTFGKSATPEFGLTTTTESSLFGQTKNPWNLEHTSGGSSGGASAAVAAGILPVANASDGGGSIRIPASCCGLVGLKPSRGRMPFGPDVGEGWSGMSTIHVVSRSVRDSAAMLDATEGPDLGAPYIAPPKQRGYLREMGRSPGQLRIGVLRETTNGAETHPDCVKAVDEAIALCESLGHRVDVATLSIDQDAMARATQSIISGNLLSVLEDRADVVGRDFGKDDVEAFTFIMTEAVRKRGASDYARGIRTIHSVGRTVEGMLQEFDVLLSPTMAAPPSKLGVCALSNTDFAEFVGALSHSVGYTQVFNASGHPAISLPLHWSDAGLPIGIQFAAALGNEGLLFQLASQLEQAQPWADRRPQI